MGQLKQDIQAMAQRYAEQFGQRWPLDYSMESLFYVESHLEELHQYDLGQQELRQAVMAVGSYVFEVASRNVGGQYYWDEKEGQPVLIAGLPDFCVSMEAWKKVQGRLENGAEDNIPFNVAGYQEQVEKGKRKKATPPESSSRVGAGSGRPDGQNGRCGEAGRQSNSPRASAGCAAAAGIRRAVFLAAVLLLPPTSHPPALPAGSSRAVF